MEYSKSYGRRLLLPLAREQRRPMTDAENILWNELRGRRLAGYKFRRQYSILKYFADFCCVEKRLIVEVDGAVHEECKE